MSKIVIAGGSGLVGSALADLQVKLGREVVVLSRSAKSPAGTRGAKWDGESLGPWKEELEGALAVVNLTGSPITASWTPENKKEILASRVRSTQAIALALNACEAPPKVWVNASAIGLYGDRGAEELDEGSAPGPKGHFLVDTAVAWEEVFKQAAVPEQVRKTAIRLGIVLGRQGGAFPEFVKFARWFLGGHHGSGSQYVSWIHVDDLARLINLAIETELPLVVNGTAPTPVTNRFFMATLRAVLGRPWSPPVPTFALALASKFFGAPDPSMLVEGCRVLPRAAQEAGFRFTYEEVREAMTQLL